MFTVQNSFPAISQEGSLGFQWSSAERLRMRNPQCQSIFILFCLQWLPLVEKTVCIHHKMVFCNISKNKLWISIKHGTKVIHKHAQQPVGFWTFLLIVAPPSGVNSLYFTKCCIAISQKVNLGFHWNLAQRLHIAMCWTRPVSRLFCPLWLPLVANKFTSQNVVQQYHKKEAFHFGKTQHKGYTWEFTSATQFSSCFV